MRYILFLPAFLFLISCDSDKNKVVKPEFTPGVVAMETADTDSNMTYFYYLPSSYDTSLHYPAIYFIDAHARGKLPVEKYKSLAAKYHYIILGSNNAKNELPFETHLKIYNILKNDVKKKFNIQNMRFYLCGFSGGSRVASNIAINTNKVPAVIGCCAGFPKVDKPIQKPFDFLGMVGNQDFNLGEMVYLRKNLNSIGFPNELIVFNGKHDWPPDSIMNLGFLWLEANAMRTYMLPKTNETISELKHELNKYIDQQKTNYRKYLAATMAVVYLKDIADPQEFKSLADSLKNLDDVKKAISRWNKKINIELAEQEQYMKNLGDKDLNWWKNEISTLNNRTDMKSKRLLNYISFLFFMNIDGMLKQNALPNAESVLPLYEMADPVNPDVDYLYACLYAMKNDTARALARLDSSIAKGFIDKEKMSADQRLNSIRNNPGFSALLEKLQ